jgi:hypothetical protein
MFYFVVGSGETRSLPVVEDGESALEQLVAVGWLATMAALAISSVVVAWMVSQRQAGP